MNDSKATTGLRINSLLPGSPAAKAGAKVGDRVVSVDGHPISSASDFVDATEQRGDIFQVEVLRGDQVLQLTFDVSTPAVPEDADPVEVMQRFQQAQDDADQTIPSHKLN